MPGLGDAVSLALQSVVVFTLFRTGASGKLVALMLINVLVDTIIGSIPLVGQLIDFFYKASERNLHLTEEYLYEGKHRGSGLMIWLALLLILVATIALVIWAIVAVGSWLVGLF